MPLFTLRTLVDAVRPVALVALVALAACERPPSADSLSEWTQGDHHSNDDSRLTGAQVAATRPDPSGQNTGGDVGQLVELTWRTQCATCHGALGHGDGQMGPMVQAPDLTRQEWQSKVTDPEMAATIKAGKNKMPAFNLPDSVLAGLVQRVRSLRSR